ncbi:MAG: aldo/keto reductase [Clostridiales Family XIII bacterium]|jgi:predicted aldo/keto reductase-like oxidoreductase|nr:aldo/keto reductase [Clostridiales Family XIII bacterium]
MEYRTIPKLNLKAGVVGLGGEHLDGKPYEDVERVLHAAFDAGVNMLDCFMPGEEIRRNIGRAIAGHRHQVMIQGMIGSTDVNKQYDISRDPELCRTYFENLLRFLGTDYIDFGMLFFMDSAKAFETVFEEGTLLRYAQDLKKAGTIRGIGASSHDPLTAKRMVDTGELDLLMFSVNPAFDLMPPGLGVDTMLADDTFSEAGDGGIQTERAALYRACESAGVAITTMKTLGSGKLLSPEFTPFPAPLTTAQCIHYALDRPAVVSALVGVASEAELMDALAYFDTDEQGLSYTKILSGKAEAFRGTCLYCSHCQPCPMGIDIAAVNRYLDIALASEEVPPSIHLHYTSLDAYGSDCTACGSCEERCPFAVPIIQNMEKAVDLFGA